MIFKGLNAFYKKYALNIKIEEGTGMVANANMQFFSASSWNTAGLHVNIWEALVWNTLEPGREFTDSVIWG